MPKNPPVSDHAFSSHNLIIRRAKTIQKVRCKCGALIPKGDEGCPTCYDTNLRELAGLPKPQPRFVEDLPGGPMII